MTKCRLNSTWTILPTSSPLPLSASPPCSRGRSSPFFPRSPGQGYMMSACSTLSPRCTTSSPPSPPCTTSSCPGPGGPRSSVQTSGHVSGACRLLKQEDYPQLGDKIHYTVFHHPVWGGWFALRVVVIFTEIRANIQMVEPGRVLSDNQAVEMIKLYNE